MRVSFQSVAGGGDLAKEHIVIDVLTDDDIGRYAVLRARYRPDTVMAGRVENAYWFPDRDVSAGDTVLLYSKKGENKTVRKLTTSSGRVHHFYWNASFPLWGSGDYAPVLLNVESWKRLKPSSSASSSQ